MKKKALLIVGLALAIATAGVVYAHWQDSLYVDVDVVTGDVDMRWDGMFTNDDNGDVMGEEANLPVAAFGQGSVDPSGPADPITHIAPRYDKAIGNCSGGITDNGLGGNPAGNKHMVLTLSNVYPSYNCNVWADYHNDGTVPVKATGIIATITPTPLAVTGPYGGPNQIFYAPAIANPAFPNAPAMTVDMASGLACGTQIDPGEFHRAEGWIHIEQGIAETATYSFDVQATFVNWNEYSDDLCKVCVNGWQLYPATATPTACP